MLSNTFNTSKEHTAFAHKTTDNINHLFCFRASGEALALNDDALVTLCRRVFGAITTRDHHWDNFYTSLLSDAEVEVNATNDWMSLVGLLKALDTTRYEDVVELLDGSIGDAIENHYSVGARQLVSQIQIGEGYIRHLLISVQLERNAETKERVEKQTTVAKRKSSDKSGITPVSITGIVTGGEITINDASDTYLTIESLIEIFLSACERKSLRGSVKADKVATDTMRGVVQALVGANGQDSSATISTIRLLRAQNPSLDWDSVLTDEELSEATKPEESDSTVVSG